MDIGNVYVVDGLFQRIIDACGSEGAAGVLIGEALHLHACADHGAASPTDRRLNEYLLNLTGLRSAHCVLSVHPAASIWIAIITHLRTAETVVREAEAPGVQPQLLAPCRRNPSLFGGEE